MRKKVALGVFATLTFSFAVYLFIASGTGAAQFPTHNEIAGVCLSCKQEVRAVYDGLEVAPFSCPKCKQHAVFPWFYCTKCHKRFAATPDKSSGQPRMPVQPRCQACGSTHFEAYYPGLTIQKVEGDAPLPKWP